MNFAPTGERDGATAHCWKMAAACYAGPFTGYDPEGIAAQSRVLGFSVFRGIGGAVGESTSNALRCPEECWLSRPQGIEVVMFDDPLPFAHPGRREIDGLTCFHDHLSMQVKAYQHATWETGTSRCSSQEGSRTMVSGAIIAPTGAMIVQAGLLQGEGIHTHCDLDPGNPCPVKLAQHREPDAYRQIVECKGEFRPPENQKGDHYVIESHQGRDNCCR